MKLKKLISKINLVIAFLLIANTSFAVENDLSKLLSTIASSPDKIAQFTETRTAIFLETPLISKGTLEFKAPSTMIKVITSPEKVEQRIIGDELFIINDDYDEEPLSISLSSQPELELGVNAVRWILSGNYKALESEFNILFESIKSDWIITLQPKDNELLENILNIIVSGSKNNILNISIKQNNGESLITELYDHH